MATKKSSHTRSKASAARSRKSVPKNTIQSDATNSRAKSSDLSSPQDQQHKIASVWQLTKKAANLLWWQKKLFSGIALVYAVGNLLLVQSASSVNIPALQQSVTDNLAGGGSFAANLTIFSYLVASNGSGSSNAGSVYQFFLLLMVSLALVWAMREVLASHAIRIRDSFYKGMYPLVPVLLVMFVVLLGMIPVALTASVLGIVIDNNIASTDIEYTLWFLLVIAGFIASLYISTLTVPAAYIAALPDMTPVKALRSAKKIVKGRRWNIARKLLYLPVMLLVVGAAIMLPFIYVISPVVIPWIFFAVSTISLLFFHAYMYMLYRELLV